MSQLSRPATLLILDGWNLGDPSPTNACHLAKTPNLDALFRRYANSTIETSGLHVGLPKGQMGNSEVGHLNLGAGRVVDQDITRIDKSVADSSLLETPAIADIIRSAKRNGATLHLIGLASTGGVHSSLEHLEALVRECCERGLRVRLHALLDGRDTPPRSGLGFMKTVRGWEGWGDFAVASVGGRYWGMDRDKRWERVQPHWECITLATGPRDSDPLHAIEASYAADIGDEFMKPVVIEDAAGEPNGAIADGDAVLFFNFRADRARQLTRALTFADFDEFPRERLPAIDFASMTEYDATFNTPSAFPSLTLEGLFADVLAGQGLRNLRVAETEKYAHVTFFFNGGQEKPWPGEERIMIPSPKVPTYDLQPEMSLPELANRFIEQLESAAFDAHIVNFANCDMVGHTGILEAAIAAVEAVDHAVGRVVEGVLDRKGTLLITADHGNVERMFDELSGQAYTAHTVGPVPLILVDPLFRGSLAEGKLADVIPTLLAVADLPPSPEMTGRDLRI